MRRQRLGARRRGVGPSDGRERTWVDIDGPLKARVRVPPGAGVYDRRGARRCSSRRAR